jgi:hypothetical protein
MKPLFLSLVLAIALTSCTNYGKKVKSGNIEVYYKDGITEDQAKKTADLFYKAIQSSNPGSDGRKSFQLTKPTDTVLLKMVVDEDKLKLMTDNESFYAIQGLVSDSIFNGNPVNLTLTDNTFKGLRTLAFKPQPKEEPVVEPVNTDPTPSNPSEPNPSDTATNHQ